MRNEKPGTKTEVIPYLFYHDVPAALDWLGRAFGFKEELRHATPSGMHAQMTFDGQRIMMGQGSPDWRMQSPSETKVASLSTCPTWTRIIGALVMAGQRLFSHRTTSLEG